MMRKINVLLVTLILLSLIGCAGKTNSPQTLESNGKTKVIKSAKQSEVNGDVSAQFASTPSPEYKNLGAIDATVGQSGPSSSTEVLKELRGIDASVGVDAGNTSETEVLKKLRSQDASVGIATNKSSGTTSLGEVDSSERFN